MKHTLVRTLLICVLIAALSCFALASCVTPCEHTFGDPTVDTAPTCTEKGSQTLTCTLCGETTTEEIPALGHDGHATCGVCGEAIVTVEQLFPTMPETAEGLKLVIKDLSVEQSTLEPTPAATSSAVNAAIVNADLNLYPTEDGIFAYGTITVKQNDTQITIDVYSAGSAILMDVTMSGDGESQNTKMLVNPSNMMQSIMSDPTRLLDEETLDIIGKTMTVIETYIAPLFEGVELPSIEDMLPADTTASELLASALTEAMQQALDTFFTVKGAETGTDVVLDLSVMHEWNATMADATLSDLIDMLCGEGTYTTLKNAIPVLLSVDVSDAIAFVEDTTGMDILDIAALIEDVIGVYMEDDTFTLDALLGISLEELLENEEFLSTTVSDFILMSMTSEDAQQAPTSEDLLAQIAQVTTMIETTKLYDLMNGGNGAMVKAQIDAAIDELEASFLYTIHLDKDGKPIGYTTSVPGMTGTMTVTDGGFTYAISGDGMDGSIDLTFAPTKLEDTTAYEELMQFFAENTPAIDKAILEDNGYTVADGATLGVYKDEEIEPEYGYASVYTETVSMSEAPFAIMLMEDEDGNLYGMMFLFATAETAEYTLPEGSEDVDLSTLTPDSTDRTLTSVSLSFEVTQGE